MWVGALRDRIFRLGTPRREVGRVLVMSTPRTGNTWLRRMLAMAYRLDEVRNGELWAHTPDDLPWQELPSNCVMQLHWHPVRPFLTRLRQYGVRTVTLARHPLDVLISILQYSQGYPHTSYWLQGEGGDESSIRGATPRSEAFLTYATSRRAAALLSLSLEWWQIRGALALRYEDLVRAPRETLGRLTGSLGGVSPDELTRAIEGCTIERLRTPENAPHFWQGKPGLWRSLLTTEEAVRIAAAYPEIFRRCGYQCDPDPELTGERADANWDHLTTNRPSTRSCA